MPPKKSNLVALESTKKNLPLSYVLENQIGFLLRQSYQRHIAIFMEEMNEFGFTSPQFSAMVRLLERGTISQNLLGRLIATDPATTQGIVKRLKSREMIKREKDAYDKRRFQITLTAKGKAFIQTTLEKASAVSAKTLEPLEATEQATLLKLIRKIA